MEGVKGVKEVEKWKSERGEKVTKVMTKDNCTHDTGAAEPRLPLRALCARLHRRGEAAPSTRARSARSTSRARRSRAHGFTLIELLVVLAVIGILVGIAAPLVGGAADRARDSQARDLCSQLVESWSILAMKNSRLPSKDLIESVVDAEALEGDLWFPMTPAAGELLNTWHSTSPIPKADKAKYKPTVAKDSFPEYDDAVDFPPDQVFERTLMQKRVGVIAPWVERRLSYELSDVGVESDRIYEAESEKLESFFAKKGSLQHGIICVALDADGDGKISLPAGTIDNDEDILLRATAAAWVWNEDKSKTIRSW